MLSKSLLRFKNGLNPDLRAWIECSVLELNKKFRGSGAAIMRALGHNETSALDNTPLAFLCRRLVNELDLIDACTNLCKRNETKKLALLSKEDRYIETFNNYFVSTPIAATKRFLIVDDILTSGATMKAIIKAIKMLIPSSSIKIFTFALCDRSNELNYDLPSLGYGFGRFADVNQVCDMQDGYDSYNALCGRIRTDSFYA